MALPVKGGDLSEMFSPFVLDEVVGQIVERRRRGRGGRDVGRGGGRGKVLASAEAR